MLPTTKKKKKFTEIWDLFKTERSYALLLEALQRRGKVIIHYKPLTKKKKRRSQTMGIQLIKKRETDGLNLKLSKRVTRNLAISKIVSLGKCLTYNWIKKKKI